MAFDINVRFFSPENEKKLDEVLFTVKSLRKDIMATLDEVLALARESNTRGDSVLALLDGVRTKLDEALKTERISAKSQAQIDEIFNELKEHSGELVQAVEANTPVEGTPDVPVGETGTGGTGGTEAGGETGEPESGTPSAVIG